jgi:hypothetical protein
VAAVDLVAAAAAGELLVAVEPQPVVVAAGVRELYAKPGIRNRAELTAEVTRREGTPTPSRRGTLTSDLGMLLDHGPLP